MKKILIVTVIWACLLTANNPTLGKQQPNLTKSNVAQNQAKQKDVSVALPTWSVIENYNFPKLVINKTTQHDFSKIYPTINNFEDYDDSIRVYSLIPSDKANFSNIKLAFENDILSWIDYIPSSRIKINQVIDQFGSPISVNNTVSMYLDYYDFGNLFVTVGKDNHTVYSFTQSGKETSTHNDLKDIAIPFPSWDKLNVAKIDRLIPGVTKKSDLIRFFPKIKECNLVSPTTSNSLFLDSSSDENDVDIPTIYKISKGMQDSNYKSIEIVFKENVLSWIDFIPKKLKIDQVQGVYGKPIKIDSLTPLTDLYLYNNIAIIVSRPSKAVLRISYIGNVNSKFREVLPKWQDLAKKSIDNLVIDTTTEQSFKNAYQNIIAKKITQGNSVTYEISEGLLTTDYDSVVIVFKNQKLFSVDFLPKIKIGIADLVKYYGKNYELDDKSDAELRFYTFDKLIVSVNKKTKLVSSIGI